MRGWRIFFSGVLLVVFQLLACFAGPLNAFADTSNFYIDDFTADYYLFRDAEGISRLKVQESITAVFPTFNQNKGICRYIPFTNQGGVNVTLPRLTRSDIVVTRNGESEPVYSIDKYDDYYEVCTGDESYVLGEQSYIFQYEYEKVVTDYSDYQELYWDANGNGWSQRFNSVTARVHFADDLLDDVAGETWCYVGRYGENGQERCTTIKIDDGFAFTAKNLASGENLTFDVEIKPGTFIIPEPPKSYVAVIFAFLVAVICGLIVGFSVRRYLRTREKLEYYEGIFVKPEYQPDDKHSLAEMAEIYIGKKKDMKVGMLLSLIVRKRISLIKKPGKGRQWEIIINNLEGVSGEERDLLMVINGGKDISDGTKFDVKKHTATTKLVDLDRDLRKKLLDNLKRDGLVEKNYRIGMRANMGMSKGVIYNTIVNSAIFIFIGGFFLLGIYANIEEFVTGQILFEKGSMIITFGLMSMTIIICETLRNRRATVENHTKAGLLASRYMDGLRLYIEMAETDRMKLLQSVDGVDVSPEGIVKIYEKLLPFAAVFGLEESWMKEMKEYCEVEDIEQPDWLMTGAAVSEMSRMVRNTAGYVTSSTIMSSSGGGMSSGFSGGGGGGFSGGGGGGGGGGGR